MQTQIKKVTKESISLAVKLLNEGEVVGIPTETVYGLGAVGTNSDAIEKIYLAKGRPSDNPLIAHIHKDYDLNKLVYVDQPYVYELIKKFTPGPLTMVFRSKGVISEKATCGGDTLALRIPSHKGCQALLKALDKPVVAPSANLSKHVSPVTALHVYQDMQGKIPLILDGGKSLGGIESTVLDVTEERPRILRAGLITKEMIEDVCGSCEIAQHKEGDKVKSPGVKYKHYAPTCDTEFFYTNETDKIINRYEELQSQGKEVYIMCDDITAKNFYGKKILPLGKTPEDIASSLYEKLIEGEKKADVIIAVGFNREDGIYLGIMNRLKKSCAKL